LEKINILIADDIDLSYLDLFPKTNYNIIFKHGLNNQSILNFDKRIDCLIIRSTRIIDKKFLDNCSIKIIATCSRGVDNIDTDYAKLKNIKIINSSGTNSISAAEHTFGLILEVFKRISLSDKIIRKGNFEYTEFERRELYGKKIGIIGVGKVGSHVAKLSLAFGMKIFANDTDVNVKKIHNNLNFKPLSYLLKHSDIITLHIPLNKENRKYISKEKLNLFNKDSVFINTSRGGVVDEKHLIKILKAGKIKFAALDVFEHEPDINPEFLKLNNVILTNHIAGKTSESRVKMAKDIFLQIKEHLHFSKNPKLYFKI